MRTRPRQGKPVRRYAARCAVWLLPLVILLGGCPPVDDDPEDECPPGTEPVADVCALAASACAAHEIPVLGEGCQPVGVPPGRCGPEWVDDGRGGCEAPAHLGACASETMAVPGDAACRPPVPCGEGRWGEVPVDEETVYVDAAYGGDDADGTETRPFRRISDALAAVEGDAPLIAVAAGTYVEALQIGRPVRIHGRCPDLVHLRGTAFFAVDVFAPAELQGLSVTGPGVGIGVGGASPVRLSGVRLHDTGDFGLYVENTGGLETHLVLEDVLVDRATGVGIFLLGSTAEMEAVVVRRTREDDPGWGRGVYLQGDDLTGRRAELHLSRAVIAENLDAGLFISGSDAVADRLLVRGTRPRPSDVDFGRGIAVQDNPWSGAGRLDLTGSVVSESEDFGLYVSGSEAYVSASTFEANRYGGAVVWGGVLDVAESAVRSTRPRASDGAGGVGVAGALRDGDGLEATVRLSGSVVEAMRVGGVHLFGAEGEIERSVIRDVVARSADAMAGGIIGLARPDREVRGSLRVTRSRVADVEGVGILIKGIDAAAEATVVHGIRQTPEGRFGDGLAVAALPFSDASGFHPAAVDLSDVRFDGNARAGASVFGAVLRVAGSSLTCSSFDMNVERRYHTGLETDYVLEDLGANVCGCGMEAGPCQAVSEGLEPAEAPPLQF